MYRKPVAKKEFVYGDTPSAITRRVEREDGMEYGRPDVRTVQPRPQLRVETQDGAFVLEQTATQQQEMHEIARGMLMNSFIPTPVVNRNTYNATRSATPPTVMEDADDPWGYNASAYTASRTEQMQNPRHWDKPTKDTTRDNLILVGEMVEEIMKSNGEDIADCRGLRLGYIQDLILTGLQNLPVPGTNSDSSLRARMSVVDARCVELATEKQHLANTLQEQSVTIQNMQYQTEMSYKEITLLKGDLEDTRAENAALRNALKARTEQFEEKCRLLESAELTVQFQNTLSISREIQSDPIPSPAARSARVPLVPLPKKGTDTKAMPKQPEGDDFHDAV